MSLAPPPCPPPLLRLRAPHRDAALFAAGPSRAPSVCLATGRGLGSGRAYCLFSGAGAGRRNQELLDYNLNKCRTDIDSDSYENPAVLVSSTVYSRSNRMECQDNIQLCTSLQDQARRGLESALDQSKMGFGSWGVETDTRRRRDRCGGPGPAAGGGGRGRSGGSGGGWFRWFSSGGFWDAAKQTVLTILGIIAAVFLIANFNVLVGAAVYPLLVVLRQIRRAITFAAYCVSRAMSAPASRPKPAPVDSAQVVAAAPVKERARMSARERVVAKWRSD